MHRAAFGAIIGLATLVAGSGVGVAAVTTAPVSAGALIPGARNTTWPGSTSDNWSGYDGEIDSGKLTEASATWVVPSVKAVTGYSSTWVGIDGADNSDLIQTGTEQDYTGSKFIYRAWWEILPAAETVIPSLTVKPGNTMTGSVKDLSGNKWVITLKDDTTGKSFSIKKTYTGPGHSAEWIQEAPTNGGVLTLAQYSETGFKAATVGFNFAKPVNPELSYPGMAIAMTNKAGDIISIPSEPAGGNAFNVAYGNTQPAAP